MTELRELLGVPEEIRAYPVRNRHRERMARLKNRVHADGWAKERAAELAAQGIPANVRRLRRGEPLCVCYKLSAVKAALAERVAANA